MEQVQLLLFGAHAGLSTWPTFLYLVKRSVLSILYLLEVAENVSACMAQNSKEYVATKNKSKSTFKHKVHSNAIMYNAP